MKGKKPSSTIYDHQQLTGFSSLAFQFVIIVEVLHDCVTIVVDIAAAVTVVIIVVVAAVCCLFIWMKVAFST